MGKLFLFGICLPITNNSPWICLFLLIEILLCTNSLEGTATDFLKVDRYYCSKMMRLTDPNTPHILKISPNVIHRRCRKRGTKECYAEYGTTHLLHKAYKLCGYHHLEIGDCFSTVTMSYPLGSVKDSFEMSCSQRSTKKYCAPAGRPLLITYKSKNLCEIKGYMKIVFEYNFPSTVKLGGHTSCPMHHRTITNDTGTILSRYENYYEKSCELHLYPYKQANRFCIKIVETYLNWASTFEIQVSDCVMRFNAEVQMPSTKDTICYKYQPGDPVKMNMKSQRDHFFLLHYFFSQENNDPPANTFCVKNDEESQFSQYNLIFIGVGILCFLLCCYYCCCCRKSSIEQEENVAQREQRMDVDSLNNQETSAQILQQLQPSAPSAQPSVPFAPSPSSAPLVIPPPSDPDLPSYDFLFPERKD